MSFLGGSVPLIGVLTGPLTNNAINQTVNVGLGSVLGESLSQEIGLDLASEGILASQATPFMTAGISQAVNQTIANTLQSAGPLAPVLSQITSQGLTALGQNFLGGLTGISGSWDGVSSPTQQWPGAGGAEPAAEYGSSIFSPGTGGPDVIFSLQPANQTTLEYGSFYVDDSIVPTTLPWGDFSTDSLPDYTSAAYGPAFTTKAQSMGFDYGSTILDSESFFSGAGGINGFSF